MTHSLPRQLILSQLSPQAIYHVLEQKWLSERRLYSRHAILSWSMNHALLTKVKTGRDSLFSVFQGVVRPWLSLPLSSERQLDNVEVCGLFRAVDQCPRKLVPYLEFARTVIVPQKVENVLAWASEGGETIPPFLRVLDTDKSKVARYIEIHKSFLKTLIREAIVLPECLVDLVTKCCWPRVETLVVPFPTPKAELQPVKAVAF
jgi:hypothetical protein